jgi:hypothetical protein
MPRDDTTIKPDYPADAQARADELLATSPDATRMGPDGPESDPAGLAGLVDLMENGRQVRRAARIAGWSEQEAFQIARDFMTLGYRLSLEQVFNETR